MTKSFIVGCIEPVSFPGLNVYDVPAKIDTGAFSGALHCSNIAVVKKRGSGKQILRFTPADNKNKVHEIEEFTEIFVRAANGHQQKRFVIDTTIMIHEQEFPIRIGLTDRSKMKLPVLVGRRFLRENNILVDVNINQDLDDDWENSR